MGILCDTLRRTLSGDLGIAWRIRIIDARQKAVESKVVGLFASRILLAKAAADAADAADLANLRPLLGIVT